MRHVIPLVREWPATVVAINLGGAVVPLVLSIYLAGKNRLYGQALLGAGVVALCVHLMASPIRGVGIAVPFFTPPLAATIVALAISREYAPALAYISGSMGTLIGADITNFDKIRGLGAPVVSIGGAGTFRWCLPHRDHCSDSCRLSVGKQERDAYYKSIRLILICVQEDIPPFALSKVSKGRTGRF